MTLFFCPHCDSHFDSNEQDHADYSGEWPKCQDCVDNEHLQRDGSSLKMTSLETPEGGKVRRAFSFNPMMKYARGYFDER